MIPSPRSGPADVFQAIPKAELHLHLEGAIPLPLLFQFIKRAGGATGIRSPEELAARFRYRDFSHFLQLWSWKNQFITGERDFIDIARAVLTEARRHNILYLEAFISPADHADRGLTTAGIIEATLEGCQLAQRATGIECQLIVDLVRDTGPETGWRCLEQAAPYQGRGVVGIGIGGTEHAFPPAPYRAIFSEARRRGLRLTAHAGEGAGPASIWGALDELGAERIGHGVRAAEDPVLVDRLRDLQLPLEMCVMSNVRTGVVPRPGLHPVGDFHRAGLLVTVNSDDPVMFQTTLTQEYAVLAQDLGLSWGEIKQISLNGIRAAFLDEERKRDWLAAFEGEWRLLLPDEAD